MCLREIASFGTRLKARNLLARNINAPVDINGVDHAPLSPAPPSGGRDADVGEPTIVAYQVRCNVVFGHARKFDGAQAQIEKFKAQFVKNDTSGAFCCVSPGKSQLTPWKWTRPAARRRCSSSRCPYTFPIKIPPSL